MKGRQLTLEEVLELKDGTKVWVEELDECYKHWSQIYTKSDDRILDHRGEYYYLNYNQTDVGDIEFYEWIDKGKEWSFSKLSESFDTTFELGSYNIISMATEICNLRGIDLTDENINKIMKEFEVK